MRLARSPGDPATCTLTYLAPSTLPSSYISTQRARRRSIHRDAPTRARGEGQTTNSPSETSLGGSGARQHKEARRERAAASSSGAKLALAVKRERQVHAPRHLRPAAAVRDALHCGVDMQRKTARRTSNMTAHGTTCRQRHRPRQATPLLSLVPQQGHASLHAARGLRHTLKHTTAKLNGSWAHTLASTMLSSCARQQRSPQ